MTVDIIVILKSVKKMLDKGLERVGTKADNKMYEAGIGAACVENARDMLDELIKQLEIVPKKALSPAEQEIVDSDLSPEGQAARDAIL